jgi:hypothetical protein
MINKLKSMFGLGEGNKPQSEKIKNLKISSSEKIKRVKIQPIPFRDGDIIEGDRKSKRYAVSVIPQIKDACKFDISQKIEVSVLAGSKSEAIHTISSRLSGTKPFSADSNPNTAVCGKWYDGNKYSIEILRFEPNT